MDALVANRRVLSRAIHVALGKSIGQGVAVKHIPVPQISDHQILVKVHSVALNPIDFMSIDFLGSRDSVLGCDYAGKVIEVGKNAPGSWKVGDRVAGFVHGGHYDDSGSFAEYLKVDGDLAWHVPDELSDDEASTYGVSAVTAMLALSVGLGLPWADAASSSPTTQLQATESRGTILIYSGSTAVGLFAIQLAKNSGCTVVTTASPRSFDLVKKYGADSVFDYRSKTAVEDISAAHPKITQALDCISAGSSTEFCAKVIKQNGGKVITLLDKGKSKFPGVEYVALLVFTVFGQEFAVLPPIGPKFPASTSDREAFGRFYANLPQLVSSFRPPPLRLIGKGFDEIISGLGELRQGKVSGQKLVANL
ncbi:putative ToxD-like zinc binding oxidoreductase [Hyaloscypha variabilis F]|uniref:Putative ToxD-like zinc binding oxidoreductase n=1 Tax=Hyaloscypha variabilis (strain UAMH 11265 / GT02V1 / F) TaxID=1149755 RepID=A0A2J6R7E7_HYAVF|nr:putative ToxD-like zinc binding oxidoreductase [Hyaloscypha variabilis F]